MILLALSGCAHVTSESRMTGTYKVENKCATVLLSVREDHSFKQTVSAGGIEVNNISGRWTYYQNTKMLQFTPFLDFMNDPHGKTVSGSSMPPEFIFGLIHMGPSIFKCGDSTYEDDYVK